MMTLGQLSESAAGRQIGRDGIIALRALRYWLYGKQLGHDKDSAVVFRVAPSLVARSEAELFGISMPRFAFRAYLTPTSFVNARRLLTLGRVAKSWGHPASEIDPRLRSEFLRDYAVAPNELLWKRAASCIGDSLLEPPHRLTAHGYRILTTELGRAYGEGSAINGTPFVRPIPIGGGQCAQAVCFMATALAQESAAGIFGVSEITALAQSHESHIDLGGMNPIGVTNYFNHPAVGLGAQRQLIPMTGGPLPDEDWAVMRFGEGLRSYLLSGVSVIVPVDLGRLNGGVRTEVAGPSVFQRNHLHLYLRKLTQRLESEIDRPRPHAVLLIGCHEANRLEFLLNDPASYPYLQASARQLAEARPYRGAALRRDDLAPIRFISITPQKVRMPLFRGEELGETRIGLLMIAQELQRSAKSLGLPVLPQQALYYAGELRLCDFGWCSCFKDDQEQFNSRLGFISERGRAIMATMVRENKLPPAWCWVQYFEGDGKVGGGGSGSTIWIWNAQASPPSKDTLGLGDTVLRDKYLLAVLQSGDDGEWEIAYHGKPSLAVSLISSFHTGPLRAVKAVWPNEQGTLVELYTFMQPEADRCADGQLSPAGRPRGFLLSDKSAVEIMAQSVGDAAILGTWAQDIARIFSPDEIPIVAMASFIPEVSCCPSSPRGQLAQKAIRFLLEFAAALRRLGHNRLKTIELVAGSRIDGIWPATNSADSERPRFIANKLNYKVCRDRLLGNLRIACRGALEDGYENRTFLALELEPGPLYVLRDWMSLVDVCKAIDDDAALSPLVGLNLDIAHWRIAGDVTPEKVWNETVVRNRVVHSHLAGHHRCSHLGDLHLSVLNCHSDFRPWVDLLRRIAVDCRPRSLPQFSGYISLEFEAAKDREYVVDSLRQLRKML